MKNKVTLLIILLAFVALILGATALYNAFGDELAPSQISGQESSADSTDGSQQEKQLAPDFTVYDLDGNEVKLSDFKGKPTVVNFWASWCSPCKMETPDFEAKYQEIGDKVNFLMVNMTDNSRETVQTASDYIATQGYTFPVYYDTAGSAATLYSVYSIPATYFIDADGHLIAQATGAIDAETLQTGLDMITE